MKILEPLHSECMLRVLSTCHKVTVNEDGLSGKGVEALVLELFERNKVLEQRIKRLEKK